jgi:hypothetical protein
MFDSSWNLIVKKLRALREKPGRYNLVYIVRPLETAHEDAEALAAQLKWPYVDFDRAAIEAMQDRWLIYLEWERRGYDEGIVKKLAEVTEGIAQRLERGEHLVIGNINLTYRFPLDLGARLFQGTTAAICVICVPGEVQGKDVLLFGRRKLFSEHSYILE